MSEEKIVSRDIEFQLTEPEYAEKGREAAEKARELGVLNAEFDRIKKSYKSKIELKTEELNLILNTIQAGKETRNVECVEQKDYDRHLMVYIHKGEVVLERPMENHERQLEIIPAKSAADREKLKQHLGDDEGVEEKSHISTADIRETMKAEKSKHKKDLMHS